MNRANKRRALIERAQLIADPPESIRKKGLRRRRRAKTPPVVGLPMRAPVFRRDAIAGPRGGAGPGVGETFLP